MMCSWRFLPACDAEDHLVDAALLVAAQVVADLVGRADRAAQPEERPPATILRAETLAVRRAAAATASGS